MKEFTIEEFDINSDDLSVWIQYYFYGTLTERTFSKEEIEEVFKVDSLYEWLIEEFSQKECVILLKYFVREYAERKSKKVS